MSNATPSCPTCSSPLVLASQGDFNPWVCPNGHGLAATTSESYERAQEDELHQLWKLAKTAPAGSRACPMCERPMVVVDLGWDSDEVPEGEAGDGADEGHEQLDVCLADEVVWFDAGELDALPADRPDPEPTPTEQAKIQQVADTFVSAYTAGVEHDMHAGVANRFADRFVRHHPQATRVLDAMYLRSAASSLS